MSESFPEDSTSPSPDKLGADGESLLADDSDVDKPEGSPEAESRFKNTVVNAANRIRNILDKANSWNQSRQERPETQFIKRLRAIGASGIECHEKRSHDPNETVGRITIGLGAAAVSSLSKSRNNEIPEVALADINVEAIDEFKNMPTFNQLVENVEPKITLRETVHKKRQQLMARGRAARLQKKNRKDDGATPAGLSDWVESLETENRTPLLNLDQYFKDIKEEWVQKRDEQVQAESPQDTPLEPGQDESPQDTPEEQTDDDHIDEEAYSDFATVVREALDAMPEDTGAKSRISKKVFKRRKNEKLTDKDITKISNRAAETRLRHGRRYKEAPEANPVGKVIDWLYEKNDEKNPISRSLQKKRTGRDVEDDKKLIVIDQAVAEKKAKLTEVNNADLLSGREIASNRRSAAMVNRLTALGVEISGTSKGVTTEQAYGLLSYNDVLSGSELEDHINWTSTNESGKLYAEELVAITEEIGTKQLLKIVDGIHAEYTKRITGVTGLADVESKFGKSKSWIIWDIAKQRYLADNPTKTTDEYKNGKFGIRAGDPLCTEGDFKKLPAVHKIPEMISRQIGWELQEAVRGRDIKSLDLTPEIQDILENGRRSSVDPNQLNSAELTRIGQLLSPTAYDKELWKIVKDIKDSKKT